MNRILTFVGAFFVMVQFSYGQNCPEPVADSIQYVCTGGSSTLADLDVSGGGTLNWYDDSAATNNIPDTTPVDDGETYYVTNTETGCSESDPIAIKVYEQSVEYDVANASCIDLGPHTFFVEEGDLGSPVEIKVENLAGNPFSEEIIWSPVGFMEYYSNGTTDSMPSNGTLGPPPADPINHVEVTLDTLLNNVQTFDLDIPNGDGCPPSEEKITFIAGKLKYDLCYGESSNLDIIYDIYKDLFNDQAVTWYDAESGGSIVAPNDTIEVPKTYYADFDIPGCDTRIPVEVGYKKVPPGSYEVPDASCIDLGSNTFFVEVEDLGSPVEIEVKDSVGDPYNEEIIWSPVGSMEYYSNGTTDSMPLNGTLGPSPADPINHVGVKLDTLNNVQTFDLDIPMGDGCPSFEEKITFIAGKLKYDLLCYGEDYNLDIIYNIYKDLFNDQAVTWYDAESGGAIVSPNDTIVVPKTYYADFDIPGCDTRIPVELNYKKDPPGSYQVSDTSCIDLGSNTFFVEAGDLGSPVEIKVKDSIGDPYNEEIIWSPVTNLKYYYQGAGPFQMLPDGTLGPGNPINHVEVELDAFDLKELDLEIPMGDGCKPFKEKITIIAGGLIYDDFCYGDSKTLNDLYDEFKDLFDDQTVTWYDAETEGSTKPGSTAVNPGETYYADFNIPGCDTRIPVKIEYKVPSPVAPDDVYFCSTDAWGKIGVTKSENLGDLAVCGNNLTWYDSSMSVINNPRGIPLNDGDIYYVTDKIDGCESGPLKIEMTETDCGCLDDDDVDFYDLSWTANYSGKVQNECNLRGVNGSSITPGSSNSVGDEAVFVTPGKDPFLASINEDLDRTSPFDKGCAAVGKPFRIGTAANTAASISAKKKFVAGEVLKFDFAMVLDEPGHAGKSFFEINIYDDSGTIIQTRCIKSDPADCIFNPVGRKSISADGYTYSANNLLYSEWSTVMLDTRGVEGEAATIEFIASWCSASAHMGYAYIDNIRAGSESDFARSEQAFGYMSLNTIENGTDLYRECSYQEMNEGEQCEPVLPGLNPDFPIEICGNYEDPSNDPMSSCTVNPIVDHIQLNITKNGQSVGTLTSAITNPPSGDDFCFELHQSDLSTPPYGSFGLDGEIEYSMNDGQYTYKVTTENSGFKICPVAECVEDMKKCIPAKTNPFQDSFDLTTKTDSVLASYSDKSIYEVSYYEDIDDARDKKNQITNPAQYSVTGSGAHTVYVRVDYDWGKLNMSPEDDCFDVISFDVILSSDPKLPDNPLLIAQCSDIFDLTDDGLRDDILVNVTDDKDDYTIDFYETKAGAQNAVANDTITNPDAYQVGGSLTTVWVRIESLGDCYAVAPLKLIVLPSPTLKDDDITITECDDDGDGYADFDLENDAEPMLIDSSANYDISYYHSIQDAQDSQDEITSIDPYSGQDEEVIYVRIKEPNTGCYVIAKVTLEIAEAPKVPTLDPYELCDEGNGKATFDLASLIPDIQDGDSTLNVDFYGSQNDADDENNALPSSYKSGSKTIYVRVGEPGVSCVTIVPLELVVNPLPELPTVPVTMEECANEDNSAVEFDLEDPSLIDDLLINVAGSQSDYDLDFYSTEQGAKSDDQSALIDTTVPYSTAQTVKVWVRISDKDTGCIAVTSVKLIVNPLPSINSPVKLRICGNGQGDDTADFNLNEATTIMIGQNPDYSVTYYETQQEAEGGDSQDQLPTVYTNTTPVSQTIYARVEDNATGCFIIEPVELNVDEAPEANTPDPLVYCDVNNDNKGSFYLPDVIPEVTTDPDATVTFHLTKSDAENDFAPLNNTIYNNQQWTDQIIYVRVSIPGVDCYTIVELELIVAPTPDLVTPTEPLAGCDEDGDGYYTFDLKDEVETVVLSNISDPSDYDIAYYADQDAIDNDTPIASPSAYESESGSVFVVVTDKDTGCSSKVELELIVSPIPEAYSAHLELCDVNDPGDEVEPFNLHDADTAITGGDASLKVSYYISQSDADTEVDSLSSPYENQVNNQTIYVRVENEYGCVETEGITLTLVVNPLPTIDEFDTYEICDIDNDGYADFDLDSFTDSIQEDQPTVEITYHLSEAGAIAGSQTINFTGAFQNSKPDAQRIWIRATDKETGCVNIGPLDLVVVPSPEIEGLEDLYVCDDDGTGFAKFDLTVNDANVIGSQTPDDLEISYYESQQDAENGEHPIAVPSSYINITNPQRIYVRLENSETGCYDTFDYTDDNSFTLYVEETPELQDAYLSVCDDDYEKDPYPQAVFDLSDAFEDITGGTQLKTGQEIEYYASEQDMLDGNPITNPYFYVNTSNPQDVYVVVSNENTENECSSEALLTLEVLPLPSPSETDPDKLRLSLCDDDNDGIAEDPFDLTISGSIIAGGENVEISYYTSEDAAEMGDENSDDYISDPEHYANDPALNETNDVGQFTNIQIVYARVQSGSTDNSCFVIVPIELEVLPQPELNPDGDPFGYTLCEDGNTGEAVLPIEDLAEHLYDYTNGDPSEIIPLLDENPTTNMDQSIDLDDYEVSYYTSETDAQDGQNPIQPGYVATDGDVIYVRVENIDSGCSGIIAEIVITVEPRPDIISTTIILDPVCSEEEGGSYAFVDLTDYDEEINPDTSGDTEVVYYANIDDYNNGHPIETPEHMALEDGQIVIAEVIDTNTLCTSVEYAKIKMRVIQRPLVDLSPWDGAAICEDLDPVTTPSDDVGDGTLILDTGFPGTGYSFEWFLDGEVIDGADQPTYEVVEEGTYTVLVTNTASPESCQGSDTVTIYEHNPPEFSASPTEPTISEDQGILVANITGKGDYEFKLDDGPWIPVGEDGTVHFTDVGGGEHFVHGRDIGGCGETVIPVNIIDYPDFFTPNNDGYNDTWNIEGLSDQPDAKIYIFDRYGRLLKQINPNGPGWDGTFSGKNMPSNDYWFKVEYKVFSLDDSNGHPATFKGHFTLKR